ncbi:MAG TPA: hypothetical protein VMZ33_07200 [Candidatus Limnocylindrales bacterium]|nr:hypothetical protein [Candidatus Limnocylindrales bacterium]
MNERPADAVRSSLERVLAGPTPDDLWELQKALLAVASPGASRARAVSRAFHSCLRSLDSKSASRTASRWGAVLGTAAVGAISLPELRDRQERGLGELLEGALPAVLEIGAAMQTATAWEIEARLIYDEFAWFLYEELWDVSLAARPDLSADERRGRIDTVLNPILDPSVTDADRATLVAEVFMSVLSARVLPLLSGD